MDGKYITLSEIVVNNKLDISSFIEKEKNDTTFYKAFRNLHIIGYTSLNYIRMLDKKKRRIKGPPFKAKQNKCETAIAEKCKCSRQLPPAICTIEAETLITIQPKCTRGFFSPKTVYAEKTILFRETNSARRIDWHGKAQGATENVIF